jgi:hypothetical protein
MRHENCTLLGSELVISYRRFGTTYRSHLQGSRIQKESWLSQYRVYIGKSGGGDTFSVEWCQPIGLMQVFGREVECGNRCSFEERSSVREEIVTGVKRGNYLK